MYHKIFVVFFIALVSTQLSEAVHVTKCKSTDEKCITSSAIALMPAFADGIPELNVAPLDPLRIDILDASTDDLKLVLTNITVTGLRKCDIIKMARDVAKTKIIASGICDIDFQGKYEMKGQLSFIPIEGNGDAYVQLNKIMIEFVANMGEKIDKKGVKHWDVKSFSHSFDLKAEAKLRLDNLFNGNKELAAAANSLFSTSPNEVVKALGVPMTKGLFTVVIKNINHFFHRIPAEDLSID